MMIVGMRTSASDTGYTIKKNNSIAVASSLPSNVMIAVGISNKNEMAIAMMTLFFLILFLYFFKKIDKEISIKIGANV